MLSPVRLIVLAALAVVSAGCHTNESRGAAEQAGATAGRVVDDSVITAKVKAALIADSVTKAHQIDVETYQGEVQLSGFVDAKEARARAAELARKVDGVRSVKNSLEVRGST